MTRPALPSLCPCCRLARWPAGMGLDGGTPPTVNEVAPSFSNATAAQPTAHALAGDDHTRDLFETVAEDGWLVIRGATVISMGRDGRLPNSDVLIRNGVIEKVQPSDTAIPAGARVIDAQGKFVIPGLAEIHGHPLLAHHVGLYVPSIAPDRSVDEFVLPYDLQLFLYLAAGVTRLEILAGTAEELALREGIRSGRLRGPKLRIASPMIDGFPAMFPPSVSWIVGDPEGARQAARQIKEQGFDFAKPYTRLSRDAFAALLDECGRLDIPVMGHIPKDVGAEAALELGQRGIAHVFEFFYNDPPQTKHNIDRIHHYARIARKHDVTVQTTLCAAELLEHDCVTVHDPRAQDFLEPMTHYMMNNVAIYTKLFRSDPALVESIRDVRATSKAMLRALVEEGVTILTGTDMPGSNVTKGCCLHEELRLCVEDVGMRPIDALRSATVLPAVYHGESGKAGQVQAGQRSDLVILNRDPTLDIRATTSIDTVILGRDVLGSEARERGIKRAIERYKAMPVPSVTA
jgi:imidazolonepropionase-like amidohydrolase